MQFGSTAFPGAPRKSSTKSFASGIRYSTLHASRSEHRLPRWFPEPGWRGLVLSWSFVVLLALIINIALLIWARGNHVSNVSAQASTVERAAGGSIVLFVGSCGHATLIKVMSHLAINVLSSLILLGSSNTIQVLCAPSREQVDHAHRDGTWMDIGILSARNIRRAPWIRLILCAFLVITSLPLHLFYNSVIYSSQDTNEAVAALVSSDFESNTTFDSQVINNIVSIHDGGSGTSITPENNVNVSQITGIVQQLQTNSSSRVQTMNTTDCMKEYNSFVLSGYGSLALVLSLSNSSQVLDLASSTQFDLSQYSGNTSYQWSCYNSSKNATHNVYPTSNALLDSCQLAFGDAVSESQSVVMQLPPSGWVLDHCRVQTVDQFCSVSLSPNLLITVIVVNAVKLLVMLVTVFILDFRPLVTVGDAIASFLEYPDARTDGAGPISHQDVVSVGVLPLTGKRFEKTYTCATFRSRPWREGRRRWFALVSPQRWAYSLGVCLIVDIIFSITLATPPWTTSGGSGGGFGAISPANYMRLNGNSLAVMSLLANLPQLAFSALALIYTPLFTAMVMGRETSRYAASRRPLRVSPPSRGAQHTSYWLSMPYRYSLPLLAANVGLHWLVSQALFLVRVDLVRLDGTVASNVLNGLGASPNATLAAVFWFVIMIAAFALLGFRKTTPGIPRIGANSLAIAAACHRDPIDTGPDLTARPIMYGVLPTRASDGTRRVGFSSREVEPLLEGEVYECLRCVKGVRLGLAHSCTVDVPEDDGLGTGYYDGKGPVITGPPY